MPMWKRRESGSYKILLANVVRCPSHPRTTALDAVTRFSGIWKQGDLHDWQPHHTSPSYYYSPLPSTRLDALLPFPPGVHDALCHLVCPIPRGGADTHKLTHTDTHTHIFFIFSRSAEEHEETGTPMEKKKVTRVHNTRRAHVQGGQGERRDQRTSHHGRNLSYPGQQGHPAAAFWSRACTICQYQDIGSRRPSCHVRPRYCSAQRQYCTQ